MPNTSKLYSPEIEKTVTDPLTGKKEKERKEEAEVGVSKSAERDIKFYGSNNSACTDASILKDAVVQNGGEVVVVTNLANKLKPEEVERKYQV